MTIRLHPSRRQMLIGGPVVGALAIGGVYVGSASATDFFRAMLSSELPGVKINDATLNAFTADCMKERRFRFEAKVKALAMACRVTDYKDLVAKFGHSLEFDKFRREMLTLFLFSTDFFQLSEPTARELTYVGIPTACSNPFAQFGRD